MKPEPGWQIFLLCFEAMSSPYRNDRPAGLLLWIGVVGLVARKPVVAAAC
jgi:hypothetical protein